MSDMTTIAVEKSIADIIRIELYRRKAAGELGATMSGVVAEAIRGRFGAGLSGGSGGTGGAAKAGVRRNGPSGTVQPSPVIYKDVEPSSAAAEVGHGLDSVPGVGEEPELDSVEDSGDDMPEFLRERAPSKVDWVKRAVLWSEMEPGEIKAEIDEAVAERGLKLPKGWLKMQGAARVTWLKENVR